MYVCMYQDGWLHPAVDGLVQGCLQRHYLAELGWESNCGLARELLTADNFPSYCAAVKTGGACGGLKADFPSNGTACAGLPMYR